MCLEEMIKSLAEMGSTLFNIQINQMEEETMTDNFKATTTPATVTSETGSVEMAPPWDIFEEEIRAMFEHDPEVKIQDGVWEDNVYKIELLVNSLDKAEALSAIIPDEKKFGNVKVWVLVTPPNHKELSQADIFKKAFKDNPVVDDVIHAGLPGDGTLTYVAFKKEVVQFYADNLRDPHGYESTLYQDIAEDIFEGKPGVCYCTSKRDVDE